MRTTLSNLSCFRHSDSVPRQTGLPRQLQNEIDWNVITNVNIQVPRIRMEQSARADGSVEAVGSLLTGFLIALLVGLRRAVCGTQLHCQSIIPQFSVVCTWISVFCHHWITPAAQWLASEHVLLPVSASLPTSWIIFYLVSLGELHSAAYFVLLLTSCSSWLVEALKNFLRLERN